MSGHNKWSKIKRKKASSDAERARLFCKHANMISVEARKAQGNVSAPGLVATIDRAKKDGLPKDNIERAIARGMGSDGASLNEVLFETYGPGGTAILITAVTDNNNRTNQEIKHLLTKAGYQLGAPGSAIWAFSKTPTGYQPITVVDLNGLDHEALTSLIKEIKEQAEVQDIFTNTVKLNGC